MSATDIAILVILLLAFAWEAWTLVNKHPKDTISESVWRASKRPLIPFLAGMLCGHFFWQSERCLLLLTTP